MRKIVLSSAILAISAGTAAHAEDKVEVEPGLYAYTTDVAINGQSAMSDAYEYCISDGNNSRTFDELMGSLLADNECSVSNVSFGGGKGSASIQCSDTGLGVPMSGQLDGYYTRTSYGATTTAQIAGGMPLKIKTTATRISDCPAGWTPPEGYSDED